MSQLFALRRMLVACVMALCSIVIVASASSADARPRHRSHHASHQSAAQHRMPTRQLRKHHGQPRDHARRGRNAARKDMRRARIVRSTTRRAKSAAEQPDSSGSYAALMPQDGVSTQEIAPRVPATPNETTASRPPLAASASLSGPDQDSGRALVAQARRYIGGNPTGRSRLWCARFMNMVLQRAGLRTTGSDMARSFASYGQRVAGPRVGAIAVMARGKRGGHVGIVSGVDANGNPIVVSGNHGRRVAEAVYARGRVYAYVMPN